MDMQYLNRGITFKASSFVLVALLLALSTASAHDDISTMMSMTTTTTTTGTSSSSMSMCRPGMLRPELAAKCWLAIFEVPLCVFQIVDVFEGGSIFKVGRACCHAFIDLTDECKIEVFQHSKLFPVIENFCVAIGGGGSDVPSPPPAHTL
ncbi:hypothetical protein LINPERPRIM_LOCUS43617 [Linum perenne]